MDDREAVAEAVTRYGRFIDDEDWDRVGALFAETVALDFTSLWGGAPETLTGADLVARWRDMSSSLDATEGGSSTASRCASPGWMGNRR